MSEFIAEIEGIKKTVAIEGDGIISINGRKFSYEILVNTHHKLLLRVANKIYTIIKVNENLKPIAILLNGNYFHISVKTKLEEFAASVAESRGHHHKVYDFKSPMPGLVLKIKKSVGDKVEKGDSIMILEAMKMENDIKSPSTGVVTKIMVNEKDPVEKGAVLFRIE